ncbi:hypothetical protein LTH96_05600 [Nesterenkonia sp. LB17]|uniref:hypothetical protein n=1 Tax=Nesterenkonia sp. LB17 TaxID=2901230 RepID=UPI001F4CD065|nr:hypothetical protein [Nesterenkonia sp. LB17]MCH8565207.1 hypothetical protein [Nesterenkonia sp. LB17]
MNDQVTYDIAERERLRPQILAALRRALPNATHADIGTIEEERIYLYATLVLDENGHRIESEDPEGAENKAMNEVPGLTDSILRSWDGYPLHVDVISGEEIDYFDLFQLVKD